MSIRQMKFDQAIALDSEKNRMSMRRSNRWSFLRRSDHRTQESGAALFRGLRVRLTLWYCGVLVAALVIFGIALYFGTQIALLKPVQDDTQSHAFMHAHQWQTSTDNRDNSPAQGCPWSTSENQPGQTDQPPPGEGFYMLEMTVCFDSRGTLLANQNTVGLPAAFLNNTVALQALRSTTGCASGTIDAGGSTGLIYRYAVVVTDPVSGTIKGVMVAGERIEAQQDALSTLLMLLLSIGSGALLCAGLGGLFLANRALAPARLAWANQQRFVADASHELRTPLTLMRADAEVLLRGRERMESEDADLLEDIVVEVNHMAKITTNLLTLARLDTQFVHREHEVIDLAHLAGALVRRTQALTDQRAITVREEHMDNAYVIGDPTLLEQAILVLLDNAIKYNRAGGSIGVRTTVQREHALLEVKDTGIGITAEHLPYLGERFYRVDKARSRAAGGTGLGLSIARTIVSTHGGQLTLTSQPGEGTTATLSLPLVSQAPMGNNRAREAGTASPEPKAKD